MEEWRPDASPLPEEAQPDRTPEMRGSVLGAAQAARENVEETYPNPWVNVTPDSPVHLPVGGDESSSLDETDELGSEDGLPGPVVPGQCALLARILCSICGEQKNMRIVPECGHSMCTNCYHGLRGLGDNRCPVCSRLTIEIII